MRETSELTDLLDQTLPAIDRHLADRDLPFYHRALLASIKFTTHFVLAVHEPGQEAAAPGQMCDFVRTRFFSQLYLYVHSWYRDQYAAAMERDREYRLLGAVSIAGTVFALRVPVLRSRPGQPGKTVWISFPDAIREDERPVEWIEAPPNLARLSPNELRAAGANAVEVADALRFIHTSLLVVSGSGNDDKLNGFTGGIIPRLERAAQLLLEPKPEAVQQAYWELQLACEHALKALQQQLAGTFKQTHDLFVLYDGTSPPPAFKRELLKRVPRWEETVDLRYGQGNRDNRTECMKCYMAVLGIVAGAVRSMKKLGIGQAEFEIQRPPWMAEVLE